MQRQLIVDTETTGLYAKSGDRLVEFAAIEMIDRVITGNYLHIYIDPERDIPEEAAAVHGITLEVLKEKNAQPFEKVGQEIFDYLQNAEFIAHNAPFDVGFLDAEFERIGLPNVSSFTKITDTLALAKERYPGQKNNLDALCNRLGVDRSKRIFHGALIDCELLADVYVEMTRIQFSLDLDINNNDSKDENTLSNQAKHNNQLQNYGSLKVVRATDEEIKLHNEYIDKLEKDCGSTPIFRT